MNFNVFIKALILVNIKPERFGYINVSPNKIYFLDDKINLLLKINLLGNFYFYSLILLESPTKVSTCS